MIVTAVASSVTSGKDDTRWSQTYCAPKVLIALEVWGENAATKGNEILAALVSGSKTYPVTTLNELKKLADASVSQVTSLSLICSALVGNILYIVVKGDGQVWLSRGDKKALLIDTDGTLSGTSKPNDVVVLATLGFKEAITSEEIIQALGVGSPEEIAEAFATALHSKVSIPVAAATVFKIVPEAFQSPPQPAKILMTLESWRKKIQTFKPHFFFSKFIPFQIKPLGIIITVLSLLLGVSIFWGLYRQKSSQKDQGAKPLTQITQQYTEGFALIDVNPNQARILLLQAKTELESLISRTTNKKTLVSLQDQYSKITQALEVVNRNYTVSPSSFFEFSLVKAQGEGWAMDLSGDSLVVLDIKNKALYQVSLSSKASKVFVGSDIVKNASLVKTTETGTYLMTDEVIYLKSNANLAKTIIKPDKEWGTITALAVFGENVYLLDTTKHQIWKYVPVEKGFSERRTYLLPDTQTDLTNAKAMQIDGSIWLIQGNRLLKFIQGKEESWVISSLEEPLGNTLDLFTNQDAKYLYIFDSENKRVVVVQKDGVYVAQYRWTEAFPVTDFVVNEKIRKIFLLSSNTLYAFEMK